MGTINAQRPGSGHGWHPLEAALISSEGLVPAETTSDSGTLLTQQGRQRTPSCVSFLQLHLEFSKTI